MKLTSKTQNSLIDEFTTFIALMLTASSIFSFASIKTVDEKNEQKLEKIADYMFVISLIGIFGIIIFMLITFWNK